MTFKPVEVATHEETTNLAKRVLAGEVVVVRRALQRASLYESIREASLAGIEMSVGKEKANVVAAKGFDRIHKTVAPTDIPRVTDAIYDRVTRMAPKHVERLLASVMPEATDYYFERSPNVRFHIPYDQTVEQRHQFGQFTKKHGQGKITAHGPHRDPWVDCPDNVINIWIAIGPVTPGNGLTVYTDEYDTNFTFKDGYINRGVKLKEPVTFDMQPGDAILFHGSHLHGSVLNRTDSTRFVISYRVTLGKPHYPYGHYHHYLHGAMTRGPLHWLAGVPQNLQMSFLRYQVRRIRNKLRGHGKMTGSDSPQVGSQDSESVQESTGSRIALDDFPIGSICAVSDKVCVARIAENEFAAVGRRCPHQGGDIAGGWVKDGTIVCPLHVLPFDATSGASPCQSVKPLRQFAFVVDSDSVLVMDEPGR